MESITHLDPELPTSGPWLICLAETACPHQIRDPDGKQAGLMLADHTWEVHGGPRPKTRKPRATAGRLHQVGQPSDQELPVHQQPDEFRYAATALLGRDPR